MKQAFLTGLETTCFDVLGFFYIGFRKGDYFRYLSEFSDGDKRKEQSESSLAAYKDAAADADNLIASHPIRLGLALNFSVFHYEIMNNPVGHSGYKPPAS